MAKRKKRRRDDDHVDQPPMTPMIDVIFQLLIYFLLTLNFREQEGKLLSQLPKDKGLAPTNVNQPELEEVRIILCAIADESGDEGKSIRKHKNDKGSHEKKAKDNEICIAYVEGNRVGELYLTQKTEAKAAHNRQMYMKIGDEVKRLYGTVFSTQDATKNAPVILDADSEVPYEHVIGAFNACKEHNITNLEFAGNPRVTEAYGSGDASQFKKD